MVITNKPLNLQRVNIRWSHKDRPYIFDQYNNTALYKDIKNRLFNYFCEFDDGLV